jgi:choline dehydrogenase-like flavoprotein
VVVGSGAGGATAAVTLARGGLRVALCEAGPWRDPEHYPSSMVGTLRDMMDDWGSTMAQGRAFWPIVQGALVGGSTVINSAICVRTPGDVLRNWQAHHGLDPELEPRLYAAQDALEEELSAEVVPQPSRGRSNELAMVGANGVGFESHFMTRYVRGCEGAGQCLQGCRSQKKQSLNVSFVPELLERAGVVLSCAPVARVRLERGRAIGVEGSFREPGTLKRGARFFVRAKRAVLIAASVTHSPLVLHRSGIRPRALGHGFRAHPGAPIVGLYDEPVDMNRGATQGWASLAFRDSLGVKLETLALPLDMLAGRIAGGGIQLMERLADYRKLAVWVQACRAESTGKVRPGPLGNPLIRYGLDRADMERFVAGLGLVARMHFAAGARAVLPGIAGMPYSLGPDELSKLEAAPLDPRAYVAILSHLFGGCVMGKDPSTSVCDGHGKVHGVEGLYISDASALPTTLGVNPQHTIMALSRVWAERLLA